MPSTSCLRWIVTAASAALDERDEDGARLRADLRGGRSVVLTGWGEVRGRRLPARSEAGCGGGTKIRKRPPGRTEAPRRRAAVVLSESRPVIPSGAKSISTLNRWSDSLLPPPLLCHSLRGRTLFAAGALMGSACAPAHQPAVASSVAEAALAPTPAAFDSVGAGDLRAAALSVLDQRTRDTLAVDVGDSLRVFAGHLFAPGLRHLYVQIAGAAGSGEIVSAVFALSGWQLSEQPLLVERALRTVFVSDTLRDANGDGFKDYALRSYSGSGCCRRNVDTVRLFDPSSGGFAPAFELMNPTYYPAEHLVRGVEYGHPGEVPLYTSRFAGLAAPERLECVFRAREQPGRYIRGRCDQDDYEPQGDTLDALPAEYESVEDLDWFMSDE